MLIIVQRDATQSSPFILLPVHSTCFGCQPHPSSGVHKTVTTVLFTPDDGCGWHPKHVEWTCRIINRLFCVASHWTIINIKNILGQLVMATKESQGLTKRYVMKTYGGWRYRFSHSSFRIYTSRCELSLWPREPGERTQSANWIRNWAGRTEDWIEETFLRCSVPAMIPQCSSWSRHSAEMNLLKSKRNLLYIGNSRTAQ